MDKYSKNLLISYIPKLLGFLILTFILVWNKLDGQEIQKRPEIIPYRFIPAGDLSCWVDIEIVEPVSIQALIGIHKEEVIEIIKERVGFELVNPMEQSQLFSIDDKLYYLVKLPYDYSSHWVDRGTKYGRK
mgnify:FL=1|jgi:hypothetical protein|tara:strand:+ start:768 stop:1160 length:393 start_codon:yes stop_codon:yes gene_type:complete